MAQYQIPEDDIRKAAELYPGIPLPLALARLKLREGGFLPGRLGAGITWGGLHAEDLGDLLREVLEAMAFEGYKAVTLRFEFEDFEADDLTHISVELITLERLQ